MIFYRLIISLDDTQQQQHSSYFQSQLQKTLMKEDVQDLRKQHVGVIMFKMRQSVLKGIHGGVSYCNAFFNLNNCCIFQLYT